MSSRMHYFRAILLAWMPSCMHCFNALLLAWMRFCMHCFTYTFFHEYPLECVISHAFNFAWTISSMNALNVLSHELFYMHFFLLECPFVCSVLHALFIAWMASRMCWSHFFSCEGPLAFTVSHAHLFTWTLFCMHCFTYFSLCECPFSYMFLMHFLYECPRAWVVFHVILLARASIFRHAVPHTSQRRPLFFVQGFARTTACQPACANAPDDRLCTNAHPDMHAQSLDQCKCVTITSTLPLLLSPELVSEIFLSYRQLAEWRITESSNRRLAGTPDAESTNNWIDG